MPRVLIQVLEHFYNEEDASEALEALKLQDGFLGGRVLRPSAAYSTWRVQGFLPDEPEADWLPDGMRRVVMRKEWEWLFGIR